MLIFFLNTIAILLFCLDFFFQLWVFRRQFADLFAKLFFEIVELFSMSLATFFLLQLVFTVDQRFIILSAFSFTLFGFLELLFKELNFLSQHSKLGLVLAHFHFKSVLNILGIFLTLHFFLFEHGLLKFEGIVLFFKIFNFGKLVIFKILFVAFQLLFLIF